jgi:hypothetical protein
MCVRACACVSEWVSEWVSQSVSQSVIEWVSQSVSEWVSEWVSCECALSFHFNISNAIPYCRFPSKPLRRQFVLSLMWTNWWTFLTFTSHTILCVRSCRGVFLFFVVVLENVSVEPYSSFRLFTHLICLLFPYLVRSDLPCDPPSPTHTHIHTHVFIYIYIYIYICLHTFR